jgi:hypothetical protein
VARVMAAWEWMLCGFGSDRLYLRAEPRFGRRHDQLDSTTHMKSPRPRMPRTARRAISSGSVSVAA